MAARFYIDASIIHLASIAIARGGSRKNIRGALAIESIIMYYKQMRHVLKNEILIVDRVSSTGGCRGEASPPNPPTSPPNKV